MTAWLIRCFAGLLLVLPFVSVAAIAGAVRSQAPSRAEGQEAGKVPLPVDSGREKTGKAGRPDTFKPDWLDDPLYQACEALVSWWPADGHAFDLAGPCHGKRIGPVTFARGAAGSAFSFPGGNALVAADRPAGLADNTFTLALWVCPASTIKLKPGDHQTYRGPLFAGTGGQRYAIFPCGDASNHKRAGCGISAGTNGVSLFEHTHNVIPCVLVHATPIKGWTHLTVVYAKGQPTLYINGAAVKTGVPSPYSVFPSTTFGLSGEEEHLPYGPYEGLIDEPMLFSRALNAREIKAVVRARPIEKPGSPVRKLLPLSDAAFSELWSYLSGKRAQRALFAVHRLAASGDDAVRRLRPCLLPPVVPGGLTVEELILQLDDDKYRNREGATQALFQMGEKVVPKLRGKLKSPLSLEVRRRIEGLLLRLDDTSETPEQMRAVRGITALGRIDTAASRALLTEIADGSESAPKTIAARAALLGLGAAGKH